MNSGASPSPSCRLYEPEANWSIGAMEYWSDGFRGKKNNFRFYHPLLQYFLGQTLAQTGITGLLD